MTNVELAALIAPRIAGRTRLRHREAADMATEFGVPYHRVSYVVFNLRMGRQFGQRRGGGKRPILAAPTDPQVIRVIALLEARTPHAEITKLTGMKYAGIRRIQIRWNTPMKPPRKLSPRTRRAIALMAAGKNNREVAEELELTVKHVYNLRLRWMRNHEGT